MIALVLLVMAQAAPSADELVKKLDATAGLKDKEKPFEISASLGRLYFGQGRYADAQTYYLQAVNSAQEARTLFLAQRKLVGSKALPEVSGCEVTADLPLRSVLAKAKALNAPSAVACLKVALSPLMDVEVMLGHTQFLQHDAAAALATYSRVLELFEGNTEARYARAALTLDAFGDDLSALGRAKVDFARFLHDAPNSPKAPTAKRLLERLNAALAAGGASKLTVSKEQIVVQPERQPGQAPVLTQEMMAAFQGAPRTPEMEANFTKLISDAEEHLAHQRFQDALNAYKQVMPYQPENPRLRAGMAWTMIQLNRQPMADNVWRVATQNPDAIIELGDGLKAKGDAEGARALWKRLQDAVPEAATKLKGRL